MNKRIFIALLLMLTPLLLFAGPTVGVVRYSEGNIQISRDGQYLSGADMSVGKKNSKRWNELLKNYKDPVRRTPITIDEDDIVLEEFDVVETGEDGYLEIEILSDNSSHGAVVTVLENTSYYFKVSDEKKGKSTGFKLLSGSLVFKVKKLLGDDSVEVETGNTTMGVRGTTFQVITMADESNLTSCSEGHVVVKSDGKEFDSVPGQVCQKSGDRCMKVEYVAVEDLDLYIDGWEQERIRILRGNLPASIDVYTSQYLMIEPEFQKAYKGLMENKTILDKWNGYLKSGNYPTMSEAKIDEIRLGPSMTMMSAKLPNLERYFYTLNELDRYYNDDYRGEISKKALKRYKNYLKNKDLMAKRITASRYYLRIYREMKSAASNSILESDFGNFNIDKEMGNRPF